MARRVVLVVLGVALAGVGLRHVGNAPVNSQDATPILVAIPPGASATTIARQLKDAGLLRSAEGFLLRVVLSAPRAPLQAGTYRFTKAESGATILQRLRGGDALPADVAATLPEGFTLEEIATRLGASGIVDAAAFREAARVEKFRDEFAFLKDVPDGSLEGYLFPDTYRFGRGTSAEDVLRRLLRQFGEQWDVAQTEACPPPSPGGPAAPSLFCVLRGNHSVHELVTMASIIEREVRSTEDRRLVSGVLWRRFDTGVGLEADATIRYVLDDWKRPLTVEDLRLDSPYNTRRYRGLPPGPIGSPGLDSLRAALQPQASDFFYYLSARDGKTIFSKTLAEHNAAIREHLR